MTTRARSDEAPDGARAPTVGTSGAREGRDILRTIAATALAGSLAAATSIAVSELVAGIIPGAPSLVLAIGALVIDLQPPGAKDVVVGLFGTNDKLALNVIIVLAALAIAAVVGVLAARRIGRADAAFVGFGLVALVAAWREPLVAFPLAVVTVVVAVLAGLAALRFLLAATMTPAGDAALAGTPPVADRRSAARLRAVGLETLTAPSRRPGTTSLKPSTMSMNWDRRGFLLRSGALAIGTIAAGTLGRALLQGRANAIAPVSTVLPPPRVTAPPLVPAESLSVPGITPIVMPNDDFYRIDTSLLAPHVDAEGWQLTVKGMVDRVVTLTYGDLAAMPLLEQYVTIACVSNRVGGDLVGNALWTGVDLRDVLRMAGVQAGATQIVGRSADGWTAGFPTAHAMDPNRTPMIALKMNGEPLPVAHGYPARLIVPGLYGYVSATKWLTEIELTTLEAVDGYWIPLGWAKQGPILTQSRIDVPHAFDTVRAGDVTTAGVAWAPDRGVSRVEVSVDNGRWQACTTSQPISRATWLQWEARITLTPGDHTIAVRATDGDSVVQTAETSEPAPDGARGHHTIQVTAA